MAKGTGNAGQGDIDYSKTIKSGKGGKMKNVGFGEELSKATGSAGMGTPAASVKENTADGQKVV